MVQRSDKSLYKQVLSELRREILQLPAGFQLPSQDDLCNKFGVSRTLIREVLSGLEREGLIIRKQGLGTFVVEREGVVQTGLDYLRGVSTIISTSGKTPNLILNSYEEVEADSLVAKKLKVPTGESLIKFRRVYTADNIPVIYAETFMVSSRVPGGKKAIIQLLENETIRNEEIFSFLNKFFLNPIQYAIAEIEAVQANDNLSKLLNIPKEKALTLLLEVHYDEHNTPLLYSLDYIDTSVFKLTVFRRKI